MVKNVFDFNDYRDFIQDWIGSRPSKGHGERSRIAEAAGVHLAYVTQVLGRKAHLSLEQGLKLASHLGLSGPEKDFFLTLIQWNRSGTKELEEHFGARVEAIRKKRSVLKNRLKFQKLVKPEDQTLYFSSWIYAAVHLLVTVEGLKTRDAIRGYLGLDDRKLGSVLEFLMAAGLVEQKDGLLGAGSFHIHLGTDSPMLSKHHSNWRMQALQALERERPDELHYSSAVTVARKDIPRIREALVKAIEEVRGLVSASAPEDSLYCYTLDLFEVGRSKPS